MRKFGKGIFDFSKGIAKGFVLCFAVYLVAMAYLLSYI